MDSQGRITVPQPARQRIGLDDMEDGENALVDLDIAYNPDADTEDSDE